MCCQLQQLLSSLLAIMLITIMMAIQWECTRPIACLCGILSGHWTREACPANDKYFDLTKAETKIMIIVTLNIKNPRKNLWQRESLSLFWQFALAARVLGMQLPGCSSALPFFFIWNEIFDGTLLISKKLLQIKAATHCFTESFFHLLVSEQK